VADQALNPTSRPGVEQNTREKSVCQLVKTGPYADLFEEAWGSPIDCEQQGDPPAYHISMKKLAVAVAAWQGSADVNSFSSPRDACIRGNADEDNKFPCDNLSNEANLGHDLFYGRNDSGLNRLVPNPRAGQPGQPAEIPLNAGCAACHNNKGPTSDGNELDQLYTDFAYHSIGLFFNRRLNGNVEGADPGLSAHDDLSNGGAAGILQIGVFKTPTLRNATKNEHAGPFTKAFFHNGYFKSIEDVVHFYNTRFDGTDQDTVDNPPDQLPEKTVCEDDPGIEDATAAEALGANCWPHSEFPANDPVIGGLVGNLGLTKDEETFLVAYIRSLEDSHTPTRPSALK
jgi:cytochrome c peroxidase